MITDNLPEWAKYNKEEDIVVVDPEVVYPIYLSKLDYNPKSLTQHQIECARRCFTEDLRQITGSGLRIRITKTKENLYELKKFPVGTPINWRSEYQRINKQNKS